MVHSHRGIKLHPRLWPSPSSSVVANTTTKAGPNPTIADFATALNGVDQPMNDVFRKSLWWSLGVLAMLILIVRLGQRAAAHIRHLNAMNLSAEQQRYWAMHRNSWLWKFKKHLLYAPLKSKRHNREVMLFSTKCNLGTLPSRFHFILLVLYIMSNLGYCLALHYSQANHYALFAELRGRSGVLGVVNMIALVIFAGRNNPLIQLLQISFDTYNLFHRWVGRVVVAEIIVHTSCWIYVKHTATGVAGMWAAVKTDPFIGWGTVGTIAFVLIAILSVSPLRHAFYETFLNVHIILAIIAIIATYIHCDVAHLPQLPYVKAIIILWSLDRIARMLRLAWYNYSSKGWTTATVEALPNDATRVTLHLPRHLNVKPGSHAYLRFAGINPTQSHPFSIAWVKDRHSLSSLPVTSERKSATTTNDPNTTTDVSFIIQAQQGFTRNLYNKASLSSPRQLQIRAAFEGPYGGHHSLSSYGHIVLIAGASGITHQIPFLTHLIQGYANKSIACRKILLVWIVRDQECLSWVQEWMDTILRMEGRRECLRIKVFVTRPKQPDSVKSASRTVQMFPGRPNVEMLVREVQDKGVVDFIEEGFTW